MQIEIMGHYAALAVLSNQPGEHNIVIISDRTDDYPYQLRIWAKSHIKLTFADIVQLSERYIAPSLAEVERGIDFCRDLDKVIVACRAGISRSSAMAVVIGCLNKTPSEALDILDPRIHNPNERVIRIGAKILNLPQLILLVDNWKKRAA